MAWVMLSLRRSELTKSISDHTYEKLQLSRQLRKLSKFSNAVGDGNISPSEIAGLGIDLFGEALDFMGYGSDWAKEKAEEQTSYYDTAFSKVAEDQMYAMATSAGSKLYLNENGTLDTYAMYQQFYEQAMKEFAEKELMPILKEKEEELENKKNELDTLTEAEQAELQQINQSISQEIQNSTIKLS